MTISIRVAGLYIHIPFCKQACLYCDFHFSTKLPGKPEMVKAICKEIELKKNYFHTNVLNSIYFGGGTPSLLSFDELNEITDAIDKHFKRSPATEVTLEANPDDISLNSLAQWKKAGINRLSIGLQSFDENELKWMNRAHSAEESYASVKMAQDKGFENITIDLIYGSKFQNLKSWEKTLEKAVELNTPHISAYNLTIEQKTALGVNFKKGLEPEVNDELSRRLFVTMSEFLTGEGFTHYEISNFGKQNYFAVHNSNYWLGHHYAGVGPSAHSYNGIERQWNIKNNHAYLNGINSGEKFFEVERLTESDKYNEYILTRLRTIWGCDIQQMEDLFGKEKALLFVEQAKQLKDYIAENKGIYTLNMAGKLRADRIASELFILKSV